MNNWLKKTFKSKKKAEVQEVVEPVQEVEVRGECFACKQDVMMNERYSKQQGKLFHKKCYKEMLRGFK